MASQSPESSSPSNGDIAVQMWVEACSQEELERLARFLGRSAAEEQQND